MIHLKAHSRSAQEIHEDVGSGHRAMSSPKSKGSRANAANPSSPTQLDRRRESLTMTEGMSASRQFEKGLHVPKPGTR
jgi:hypothetical protein